jgi:hypothetical protein
MTIRELRILPPLAIGRLGGADTPLDNYVLEEPAKPLEFRTIKGAETLIVDDTTGEITGSRIPDKVVFKENGKIRPVWPFLEVFVVTDDDAIRPLDLDMLAELGLKPSDLKWQVEVANRKVVRRTDDPNDQVTAKTEWFSDHVRRPLHGHSANFISPEAFIDFGHVQYIKPNEKYPGIRFRFMPAKGLIYGPRVHDKHGKPIPDPDNIIPPERAIYEVSKRTTWYGFEIPVAVDDEEMTKKKGKFWNETLPSSLFAIDPPAPPWLYGNYAKSRGYLDDACDGVVEVSLKLKDGRKLSAMARITASPPALVPDAGFLRTLADDLDQVINGPKIDDAEPAEVTRARAEDIVRRAYETVRFMNVGVMNGGMVEGRPGLSLDTMPAEEAFDTERLLRPVMSEPTVDTITVMALHQQLYAAMRGGTAPWFTHFLRLPNEAGDYTDRGRRKMPALMCGADNNYLSLTWRQIETIKKAATAAGTAGDLEHASKKAPAPAPAAAPPALTPRNKSAQLLFPARGNPASSRVDVAVGNCVPGLEMDFRAVWRRLFTGIVLREYDNLVVEVDPDVEDPEIKKLVGHRLLMAAGFKMMTTMVGPSPADPAAAVVLSTENNPHGLAPLEWSNALAHLLHFHKPGAEIECVFTAKPSWYLQHPYEEDKAKSYRHVTLKLRPFWEKDTAVISRDLVKPGELTQGLCSPWQNDYRECSCYYWASARPDYVNVEPGPDGTSKGDNWLQKERAGHYVPDDYQDERLILYDDLFHKWEHWLRFQIQGRDVPGQNAGDS